MAIEQLPSTGDTPRSTGVPDSLIPGGAADSAGFPWAGRTFDHHETAFAGDDGAASEQFRTAVRVLREAAESFRRGSGSAESTGRLAAAHADALLELSSTRVLIPLLAEAGDLGTTPDGRTVEKTQELSIVTVAAPDGRRVMPVFSSVDTMRSWNPAARPIPVPMPQVALAAAQEQTDLIIVDPGTPECELGVRRTQLEPVALGKRVSQPWANARIERSFLDAFEGDPRVFDLRLLPGDPEARLLTPETDVVIALRPGLDRDDLGRLLAAAQERWAASALIAASVDSLRVVLREIPRDPDLITAG